MVLKKLLTSLDVQMKRVFFIMAGLFVISASMVTAALPETPPAGYDQYRSNIPHGARSDFTFYSALAGMDVEMVVYTPPEYDSSRKYGVIYCYKGIDIWTGTIFDDWCVNAGTLMDNLVADGVIEPLILVEVDNQYNGAYGSDVAGVTINDAIPYIDSHYSTYADADHRGVYGYSWGGGHAFNVGCQNLDFFRYVGPSAAAPDKAGDDQLFPNGGAEAKQKLKCLFFSCGTADSLYGISEGTHNFCVANNIPHFWWSIEGAWHDAGTEWRPAMWNFLQLADAAGISDPPEPISAYSQIEAEAYNLQSGIQTEECIEGGLDVGYIENGDYLVFRNVDFGAGANSFDARIASAGSGGNIELYLDSLTGTQIGSCTVPVTGDWQTWITVSCSVSGPTGMHDLYMKFTGGDSYLFNINWFQFIPDYTNPPSGLAATKILDGQIKLTWNEVIDGISYNVKRSANSGGPYTVIASDISAASFTDTDVIGDVMYYYVVSANTPGGESADSIEAQGIALEIPPSAPAGLTATADDSIITLSWNANSEVDVAGYNIYRATILDSEYVLLNGSLLISPEFTDDTAVNFNLYYYVVTAVDFDTLESPYSNEVQVMLNHGTLDQLSRTDFESGWGDWVNISGEDSDDWTRDSGGTLTPNTGPSAGANGSTWYVYLETSPSGAGSPGDTAILESPAIEGCKRVLMFYYHMYGTNIGTLNVDVYDGTWHEGVWSLSGPQQTSGSEEYLPALLDLRTFAGPIQLRFRAVAAGGPGGDMAIDNIEILGKSLYGDMDGNNQVDAGDISEFLGYWLQTDCDMDVDGDCVITLYEFAEFANNWIDVVSP